MKLFKTLIFISILILCKSYGQAPNIQWQKCFGGTLNDIAYSICELGNGNILIVGKAESEDGDVTNHIGLSGFFDVWLIKIDSSGNLISNKCYGGPGENIGYSIKKTIDGGIIIAGSASGNGGDVSGVHQEGREDYWVVKIDSIGNIQWQKCLGSTDFDEASDIIQTSDSGYVVTGYVSWLDGDVVNFKGGEDMWVAKLNRNGVKEWTRSLGGGAWDWGNSCVQTNDGGYLTAGSTMSINGDVSGNHGGVDAWVVKLSLLGQIEWQKCYGGSSIDNAYKINLTNDGGFFLSVSTSSSDSEVTNNNGGVDFWLIKADSIGNIEWQKCYGGTGYQSTYTANATSDGGMVLAGTVSADDNFITGTHGMWDWLIVKVDSEGNYQWGKVLGGTEDEVPYSIQETSDGGYLTVGYTSSYSGDITSNHGNKDYWVVKLAPLGQSIPELQNNFMELNIFQSQGQLNLRFFSTKNETAQLCLYDLNGKKVFEKNISVSEGINFNSFNCSGFVNGMYFVKIDGKNGSLRGKVAIQSER